MERKNAIWSDEFESLIPKGMDHIALAKLLKDAKFCDICKLYVAGVNEEVEIRFDSSSETYTCIPSNVCEKCYEDCETCGETIPKSLHEHIIKVDGEYQPCEEEEE